MLHLNARIHLDEIPAPGVCVDQELDRSGVSIFRCLRQPDRRRAQLAAKLRVETRRRRDFHHLLMAALHGAIALPEMKHVAVMIGKNLNLDMPRARDVFFEEHRWVAERRSSLVLRFLQSRIELGGLAHYPHSAPAAAHCSLDHHRKSDSLCKPARLRGRPDRMIRPRKHRHARRCRQPARGGLVAEQFQQLRRGSDERDSGFLACSRKRGVLRQESIAGMNRVHAFLARQPDQARDVQIRLHRPFPRADLVGFVGLEPVQAQPVLVRIDADCF